MNYVRIMLGVLAIALLPLVRTAGADDARDIIGTWKLVGFEAAGEALTAEQVGNEGDPWTLTIAIHEISLPEGGDGATRVRYTLDQAADPAAIDLVDLNGAEKGAIRKGIYELHGDTLRLCIAGKGAKRPGKFTAQLDDAEAGEISFTFMRKKE